MKKNKNALIGAVFVLLLLASIIGAAGARIATGFEGKILPQVYIGNIPVGGLTPDEAEKRVRERVAQVLENKVSLSLNGVVIDELAYSRLGVSGLVKTAVSDAEKFGRPRQDLSWILEFIQGVIKAKIPLNLAINQSVLDKYVSEKMAGINKEPVSAGWTFDSAGVLRKISASEGRRVDQKNFAANIVSHARKNLNQPLIIDVTYSKPQISDEEAENLKQSFQALAARPFTLKFGDKNYPVPAAILKEWIILERLNGVAVATYSTEMVKQYLNDQITVETNKTAQDARFEMADGRVTLFSEARNGNVLNLDQTAAAVKLAAKNGLNETALVVDTTEPQIKSVAEAEKLGIKDLLGKGESNFAGSPRNRIHNIEVGTARFHGLLIPPGVTFAFNQNLGPVNKEMGYKPELVIKENVTTPEYGGGLCQVSTTAFRAAMLSGLKIVERSNHAYPVSYYGVPGFDATIYPNQRTWSDGTDLKFLNDTPGHILIQTKIEGSNLIFEFWGTSDGREVKLVGPTVYGRQPSGALKATLTRQISKNEKQDEQIFLSSYKSPALFPHATAANAEKTWEEEVKRIAEKDRKAQAEFEKRLQLNKNAN